MSDWTTLYFLSTNTKGFGFNPDLLETNLVNILLLIGLLVYVLGNFLKETLSLRQEEILMSLQECEKRLSEAKERWREAIDQWDQTEIMFVQLFTQTKQTKQKVVELELLRAHQERSQFFHKSLQSLNSKEQQVFDEIKREVAELALAKVKKKIQGQQEKADQSSIIDTKIKRLGGQL